MESRGVTLFADNESGPDKKVQYILPRESDPHSSTTAVAMKAPATTACPRVPTRQSSKALKYLPKNLDGLVGSEVSTKICYFTILNPNESLATSNTSHLSVVSAKRPDNRRTEKVGIPQIQILSRYRSFTKQKEPKSCSNPFGAVKCTAEAAYSPMPKACLNLSPSQPLLSQSLCTRLLRGRFHHSESKPCRLPAPRRVAITQTAKIPLNDNSHPDSSIHRTEFDHFNS